MCKSERNRPGTGRCKQLLHLAWPWCNEHQAIPYLQRLYEDPSSMVGLPPFDLQVCCNLLLSIERMFLEARTATCATEQNWELDGTTWQKFQCKTTRGDSQNGCKDKRRRRRLPQLPNFICQKICPESPASISTLTGSILHHQFRPREIKQNAVVVWSKLSKRQGIVSRCRLGMHPNDRH